MRFNLFNRSEDYQIQADKQTTFDSDDDDSAYSAANPESGISDSNEDESYSHENLGSTLASDLDFAKNAQFQYGDINPTTHVRLFRILKATKRSVEGHFKAVRIADLETTTYYALSYTWRKARTDKDIRPIKIGSETFYVRRNLWDFLIMGGPQYTNKYIYIDAVCINQHGLSERSHQVKLMAAIYDKADCVVVWLGKPLQNQDNNLKALQKRLAKRPYDGVWSPNAMFGLAYLCSLKYWTRLWIVQEQLLAKRIMIRCGEWRFEWDDVADLQRRLLDDSELDVRQKLDWWHIWEFKELESYLQQENAEKNISKGWESALRIFDHRAKWKQRRRIYEHSTLGASTSWRDYGLPFHNAVRYFSQQDCQDLRDKVYAVVGLVEGQDQRKITPSYHPSHGKMHVFAQALVIGLLSLQREIEPDMLATGYYPADKYREWTSDLQKILGLTWNEVEATIMEAFKNKEFREAFAINYKNASGDALPANMSPTEAESNILYEFMRLTEGKESGRKVFGVLLHIQGKRHFTSAALTAARSGYFDKKRFLAEDERQGVSFRVIATAAKVWHRLAHLRPWTPFGG